MTVNIKGFPDLEEQLVAIRRGVSQAMEQPPLLNDPYKRTQYSALARQLAGAIAIVHVIEGEGSPADAEDFRPESASTPA